MEGNSYYNLKVDKAVIKPENQEENLLGVQNRPIENAQNQNNFPEKPKSKLKIILTIGIIFLLVLGGGWVFWKYYLNKSSVIQEKNQTSVPSGVIFEEYIIDEYGVKIQKPVGWEVAVSEGNVYVKETEDYETQAIFSFIKGVTDKINAVALANEFILKKQQKYPDFTFNTKVSQNKGIVELDATFINHKGNEAKGFYIITLENGNGFYGGYESLVSEFDNKKNTLDYILKSIQLLPQDQNNTQTADLNQSIQLVAKSLSDSSASIDVPSDWNVSGANVALVALNPEQNCGYIGQSVTIISPQYGQYAANNLVSDYKPPKEFVAEVYLPALGNKDINVLEEKDASSILEGASGMEAKTILITATTSQGIRIKGLFLVITMSPDQITGNWYALVYGFWTPEDQFDSKFTLMTRIAFSFKANEEYIAKVMQQNIENSRRIAQRTSQILSESYDIGTSIGESKNEAFDKNYQKWNDYAAGEERYYSAVEDKVYSLPAGYDNYYNPQYNYEEMSPLSGDQWKTESDRSYLPGGWHY